jgi:hypothetical protein
VFFIKLIRILGIAIAAGLIYHLLRSMGRKRMTTGRQNKSGSRRKYVESSVVDDKDEPSESDKENPDT